MTPLGDIAARSGIGLKAEHYRQILETRPRLGFVEIHAENYMGDGGPPHAWLTAIRAHYPLSLHGVGLSIGGEGPLDAAHLRRLKALIDRYQPALFSEHLAWSTHERRYFADLLPLPYTRPALDRICEHIDTIQSALNCRMLLENPSAYLAMTESTMNETEFLRAVVARTGCGLLLDVNNVVVSARNIGFDPIRYVRDYPMAAAGEIHLAGHDVRTLDGETVLIDAHASPVAAEVWSLFELAVELAGPLPTLIERDNDVPALRDLLAECERADAVLRRARLAA